MRVLVKLYICHVCTYVGDVWELKRVQIEVCHLCCSWEAHNRTTQSEHGVVCAGCLQTHVISDNLSGNNSSQLFLGGTDRGPKHRPFDPNPGVFINDEDPWIGVETSVFWTSICPPQKQLAGVVSREIIMMLPSHSEVFNTLFLCISLNRKNNSCPTQ